MRDRGPIPLLVCLALALTLRLAFVFIGFPYLQPRWNLREDGDGYGLIAQSIREGRYTDISRGPAYPVFVALAGSPQAVKVLQAFIDTATCALIFWLARLAVHPSSFIPQLSLWAAWLWALYPFAIWRVAFINKEVVLASLVAGTACWLLHTLRQQRLWQWMVAGGLLAMLNLCKPSFLLWPLLLFAFAPRRAAVAVAAMLLLIAPWSHRNWRLTGGEFLPVATELGGATTFMGNYQPTLGMHEGPGKALWMAELDGIARRHAGASPVELDRIYYREAFRHMMSDPATALELIVRKAGRFWFFSAARRVVWASVPIQAAYLALAGVGLWRLRPLRAQHWLMLSLVLYVMAIHALSSADLRYSLPVMPLVCVLAGYSLRNTPATASAARCTL